MRLPLIALGLTSMLVLGACSAQVSTAHFCRDVNADSVKFAALQDQPTPALVKGAAQAMARLAAEAPSQIRPAMKTEAAAYHAWAKTGSNAPLTQSTFSAADDQLSAWLRLNCKGR